MASAASEDTRALAGSRGKHINYTRGHWPMGEPGLEITLERTHGYQFAVDFGQQGVPSLLIDETPPLGEGHGPNPARMLAAAVGHCLSASALFCLTKAHVNVRHMRTTVNGTLVRNDQGRLRIRDLTVRLHPDVAPEDRERLGRCLELFEDFCVVTQSVRRGIDVHVFVEPVHSAANMDLSGASRAEADRHV
jgi:organic hydroperoxide reductase OsmC/OhrA